jgi:hypothetical protein
LKVFSVNALAELFELDRQTVVRALRGTPAEGKERGQPRWRMKTAVAAIERHNRVNNGVTFQGGGRLGQIADELERLHGDFDAAIELIKSLPDLDCKQPHSRAAMQLINRIDALYNEANELDTSGSGWPYVTPMIVGTSFRTLLAAIYGSRVEIDGVRMFSDDQIKQLKLG